MLQNKFFFYSLSFLEGASVMAAELLGAKMLAPFFGSSLYVWSSVLSITLGGLASGYFAGGVLSQRKNQERNLYYILLASAVFLMLMPVAAKEVMVHTASFSLLVSIVISSLIFLFPPVFFMGMVSPVLVAHINNLCHSNAGRAAGTVYAISTIGGIIATFLLGFYLIPEFGLIKPAIVMGIILGIIPFVKLITSKKIFSLIFIIAAFMALYGAFKSPSYLEMKGVKYLYSSEGLLGQIIVADYPADNEHAAGTPKQAGGEVQRVLFVNRSMQTIVTSKNGEKKFFDYVNLIAEKTKMNSSSCRYQLPQSTTAFPRALVLGLGGGCVANELVKNGLSVDAVELDARIAEVSKKYFELNQKVNVTIDDARHFILSQKSKVKSQKYNVIVLDAFIGEENPHHLFTKEFFAEVKTILSDGGAFFINGNGYWGGEAGKGMRSVCKTLLASGFDVEILPSVDGEEEDYRNLVFIATPAVKRRNDGWIDGSMEGRMYGGKEFFVNNSGDAIVLSDEKPQLEILNAEANKRWRKAYLKYFMSGYYSGKDVLLFQ